jgi:formiminoglutamase
MENISFLQPVNINEDSNTKPGKTLLGNLIQKHIASDSSPELAGCKIAIVGVEESRRAVDGETISGGPDLVRQQLYKLHCGDFRLQMADLGNIPFGHSVEDTYAALSEVVVELLENNVIPIIIGGSNDLSFACYKAYAKLKRIINIAAIDRRFDLGNDNSQLDSENYLKQIIVQQPNFLFNYTNIGYQSYFESREAIKLMENLFFDSCRLGVARDELRETEPLIRNADFLSFDIGAIRASDAPGQTNAGPNGFFGNEACQLARYAGLSEKLSMIGFFEYNPRFDTRGITAQLIAQMIWYFIDGLNNRPNEEPLEGDDNFIRYLVKVDGADEGIVFYRSKRTNRWWMEIGAKIDLKPEYRRHNLIPCSQKDYATACENDIPDRWWKAFQKLM